MPLLSYYASVPGTSHIALGLPDQDAFAVNHLRSGWSSTSVNCDGKLDGSVCGGEFLVAAVADGLGSKEYPEIGSREAATAAVTSLSLAIMERRDLSEVDDLVLTGVVHTALMAVERKAAELGVDVGSLATTLAVCAFDGERVVYAIAGDSGFVVRNKDGSYRCLGEMARGGNRTTVYPLSAYSQWQFGRAEGVNSVILATDGMLEQLAPGYVSASERARPSFGEVPAVGDIELNDPLLSAFLDLAPEDARRPSALISSAEAFLKSLDPIDVYDDKTVVVLYNSPELGEDGALDLDFAGDEELEAAGLLESANKVGPIDEVAIDSGSDVEASVDSEMPCEEGVVAETAGHGEAAVRETELMGKGREPLPNAESTPGFMAASVVGEPASIYIDVNVPNL